MPLKPGGDCSTAGVGGCEKNRSVVQYIADCREKSVC